MHRILKITLFSICTIMVVAPFNSFGQEKKKKPEVAQREKERKKMHARDSVLRSFSKADTSINSLLQSIEHYTTTFNQINNSLSEGLDTDDVTTGLPPVMKRLKRIDSLTNTHRSSTLRYLFVLRDNLDHLQGKLEGWQGDLEDVSTKLIQNQTELVKFSKDTSLRVIPSDSLIRVTFFEQRDAVVKLYRHTDSVNRADLLRLNLLQDKVAVAYTRVLDETDQIDLKIKRFAARAIAGESDYIWNTRIQTDDFKAAFKGTWKLNGILYNYFIKNETTVHYIGFFFFICALTWIFLVRTKTLRHHENPQTILDQANLINRNPFVTSLLIGTALIPYFYDHPPVVFLESLFLTSMVLCLILIKRVYHSSCFNFLLILFVLTFVFGASNLFIQIATIDRFIILLLSVASIVAGVVFMRQFKKCADDHFPYTGPAVKIFIALQSVSLLLNISGRFSLAKIVSVTAAFNLWMVIILYFVVQTISQALFLQFQVKKGGKSMLNYIDYPVLQKNFRKILITLASLLWLFFLLQNLNIDDWANDSISDLLSESRSVGGASFTFGGFVVFIAVIWISSILSRLISYFYDISSQKVNDLSVEKKKNRTSALLIRIGVFSLGFLLAVASSGFPLEKLTIIISAFGVGIGFGLQNIVNNLVSGIILAFEKPIQIGDLIEVDNKSGRMKEIGIRSSKILTSDGAEVIIPNGDLISQHVINWTLSNNYRRIDMDISVAFGSDILKVEEILKGIAAADKEIIQTPVPLAFMVKYGDASLDFKLLFWAIADSTKVMLMKSRLMAQIYGVLEAAGIEIPSDKKDVNLRFPDGIPSFNLDEKSVNDEKEDKPDPNKSAPGQDQ